MYFSRYIGTSHIFFIEFSSMIEIWRYKEVKQSTANLKRDSQARTCQSKPSDACIGKGVEACLFFIYINNIHTYICKKKCIPCIKIVYLWHCDAIPSQFKMCVTHC